MLYRTTTVRTESVKPVTVAIRLVYDGMLYETYRPFFLRGKLSSFFFKISYLTNKRSMKPFKQTHTCI